MNSKSRRNRILFFRWGSYTVLLLLAAVMQTMPGFLTFWGVKPVFILPLCLAVAVYQEEVDAAFFGVLCGLVWDFTGPRTVGLMAFSLMIACYAVSLIARIYFRVSLLNFAAVCLLVAFVILSLDFLFSYAMRGYEFAWVRYFSRILPMILLTGALSWIWLFPVRRISVHFELD